MGSTSQIEGKLPVDFHQVPRGELGLLYRKTWKFSAQAFRVILCKGQELYPSRPIYDVWKERSTSRPVGRSR